MSLKATGLEFGYGGNPILKGLDLEVRPGETVGLLGPNGAGKTTLVKLLVGLLSPRKGRIELDGIDVSQMPLWRRVRAGIGFLAQNPAVFGSLTVNDNLMLAIEESGMDKRKGTARAAELAAEYGLADLRRAKAETLSGGERRRLELVRTLLLDPRYILFDEPFAGIDPLTVETILKDIARLKTLGKGILISDHNARAAMISCDRICLLLDGRIVVDGPPDQVRRDPTARRAYLGESFE